jgi:hypothetical protein
LQKNRIFGQRPQQKLVFINNTRKGIFITACLLVIGFVGCISIPLGDPEKAKVDDKLLGAWLTKPSDDGKQSLFTIVPYDSRTCLVAEMGFEKDGDTTKASGRFDWKMWLVDIKGTTFASLEMKNPQTAVEPLEERYAIARIKRDGDTISLQLVKDEFVKGAKTSADLEKLVGDNVSNDAMYDDAMTLVRVGADQKEAVGKMMDLFNGKSQ